MFTENPSADLSCPNHGQHDIAAGFLVMVMCVYSKMLWRSKVKHNEKMSRVGKMKNKK